MIFCILLLAMDINYIERGYNMLKNLNVVFMGTPSFGSDALLFLIEKTNVSLVVTQPDKVIGRKKILTFPYIKKMAMDHNIEVFQPVNIKTDYDKILEVNPDIIITAAYGQIVPKEVLNIPRFGCINLHGSILPKYRGAAPIQWSLINGDKETGVSLMYMDEKMDTGNIIDIKKTLINNDDNFDDLYNKLGVIAKEVLSLNLEKIVNGTNDCTLQNNEDATYARMLTRDDELINFNNNVDVIHNQIRGVYPNGYIKIDGSILKILKSEYSYKNVLEHSKILSITKDELCISGLDGVIKLLVVKPNGKNEMPIKSYLNGIKKDEILNKKINID